MVNVFFGWLDLKQSEIRGSARRSRSQSSANKVQPNLLRLGNSACMHGIFFFFFWGGGGVKLWSRGVLLEALGLRGGFGQFSPYSIIPVT